MRLFFSCSGWRKNPSGSIRDTPKTRAAGDGFLVGGVHARERIESQSLPLRQTTDFIFLMMSVVFCFPAQMHKSGEPNGSPLFIFE